MLLTTDLDTAKSYGDIFALVKKAVKLSLSQHRMGLMLYLGNLPMRVGAFHPLGTNDIVLNRRLLDASSKTKPQWKAYVFSILLHEYLHTLGNIRGLKGDYGKARSYYQKVISLDSTYIDSYVELAQLEMVQGDLRLARGYFEQAEGLQPKTQAEIEIYSGLGTIHDELGETEQAKKTFERALLSARHFVHEFPDKPIPYLKLGESFFNVGKIDSAVNFLEISEFMEDRPVHRGRVLLALGKAYQERGDVSRARRSLQEVLGLPCGFEERKQARRLLKSM